MFWKRHCITFHLSLLLALPFIRVYGFLIPAFSFKAPDYSVCFFIDPDGNTAPFFNVMPHCLTPFFSVVGGLVVTGHRGPRHLVFLLPRRRSSGKSRRRRCIYSCRMVAGVAVPPAGGVSLCRVAAFTPFRWGTACPSALLPGSEQRPALPPF